MIPQTVAAALLIVQASPSAERPCMTPQEAGDVAVAMLPYVVDAAARHCRAHVSDDSFIATGAGAWSERLRRDGGPRRASALRGIAKMSGAEAPEGIGGDAAFQFFAQMISVALSASIRPESCAQVDTIARSLEPLPTDNIANLIGATLTLAVANANQEDDDADEDSDDEGEAEAGEARRGPPPICPA